jgi:transcriptional regulator with XRE-family HTH domain
MILNTILANQTMADINIPHFIKDLRRRLGLTQEQFAREVGVTFSTVNQWENGRRKPQPFLLKRLLEMEAELDKNPVSKISKAEARAFKKRWESVNAAEREELASTSLVLKFRQFAALLASAGQFHWTKEMAAEENQVRERWARLRKVYGV